MKALVHTADFNVHDLFYFRVSASKRKHLNIFTSKFSYFLCEKTAVPNQEQKPNIDIILGKFAPPQSGVVLTTKDSICGRDYIQIEDHYKILRWSLLWENIEDSRWTIRCQCNLSVGYEALITKVLRPLFSLRLALEQKSLLHCSALSQNGRAFTFNAFPGVGKTSLSLFLLRAERSLVSDENTLIDQNGHVYSFPLSIPVTSYNLNFLPQKLKLNLKDSLRLKFGDMVHFLSRGFLEKSLSLQPEKYFPIQDRTELDQVFIIGKSPGDFSIHEISTEKGVQMLHAINDYEMSLVNKYLTTYSLGNSSSRLLNKDLCIMDNLRQFLRDKKIFYINFNQADLKKSFAQMNAWLEG